MQMEDFRSLRAAKEALLSEGYCTGFSSPGRPEIWVPRTLGNKEPRYAIQREKRDGEFFWHIVPYPEPAVANPATLSELIERDGPCVVSGAEMAKPPSTADEPDPDEDVAEKVKRLAQKHGVDESVIWGKLKETSGG